MSLTSNFFKKVVLDTSPLIDALAIDFAVRKPIWETQISRLSPLTDFLRYDVRRQRQYLELLGSIEEIVITSNVVGEIRSERYSKPEDLHEAYWGNCLDFFRRHQIREELVSLSDLEKNEGTRKLVCQLGPTDAGLMVLADREECFLLTNDDRWYSWQSVFRNLEVRLIKHMLDS